MQQRMLFSSKLQFMNQGKCACTVLVDTFVFTLYDLNGLNIRKIRYARQLAEVKATLEQQMLRAERKAAEAELKHARLSLSLQS